MTGWQDAERRAAELAALDDENDQDESSSSAEVEAVEEEMLAEANQVVSEFLAVMDTAGNPGGIPEHQLRNHWIRRFVETALGIVYWWNSLEVDDCELFVRVEQATGSWEFQILPLGGGEPFEASNGAISQPENTPPNDPVAMLRLILADLLRRHHVPTPGS